MWHISALGKQRFRVTAFEQFRKRGGLFSKFLVEYRNNITKEFKVPRSQVNLRTWFKYFALGWH